MHHHQSLFHPRKLCMLFAIVSAALTCTAPCFGSGIAAQRIVAHKTVEALPEPLSQYFISIRGALLERAVEPAGLWQRLPRFKNRNQWYFIYLDVAAEANDQASRDLAANAFPTDRRTASKLMAKHGVKRGGRLPWALEDLTKELSQAFESKDKGAIAQRAGHLIAFCAYAADPFRVTRNQRGEEFGNAIFADAKMGDPLFAHQHVAQRFGWELVRQNANRYREAIDAATFRYALEQDAAATIFETMLDSLDVMSKVCEADRATLDRMQIGDGAAFLERSDEYYQLLDAACGDEAVEMLARASRLSVALIYDAYRQAGSPDLTVETEEVPDQSSTAIASSDGQDNNQPSTEPSKDTAPKPASGVVVMNRVASKRSKVFHRPTCSHVQRISEKNRVEYKDVEAAKASGKRGCKACDAASAG